MLRFQFRRFLTRVPLHTVTAEIKLARLQTIHTHLYMCHLFRPWHELEGCVNAASVLVCVVLATEKTTPAQKYSDPSVF